MNIIKSLYKAVGCAVIITGLSSCTNDWLDVSPSDSVNADNALASSTDLTAARAGMYAGLKGNRSLTDYYARGFFIYGDLHAGDDLQSNELGGSGRATFYYEMNYTSASEFDANAVWQSPYITIGRANRIIAAAEGGNLADKEEAKDLIAQYEAEAKTIRALAHFDLVRVYGKPYTEDQGASAGVPITTEVLEPNAQKTRNTVKEVYDQVIKDLTDAINSKALPTDETPGYVNEWSAKAILARVYLTKGDYTNALSTSEDIIKNSPYKLWTQAEYNAAWSAEKPNENEFLFRLNTADSNDETDLEGIGNVMQESGYGDVIATKSFLEKLESDPKDVRNELFYAPTTDKQKAFYGDNGSAVGGKGAKAQKVFLNKFRGQGGNTRIVTITPIIRLSEIYLTAAEAALQTGDKTKAAEYLNDLIVNRTSDESKKVTASTVTQDRILLERRKELVGEGQRYFDALRTGEKIVRYTTDKGWHSGSIASDAISFDRDNYKAISAIPQAEINANPGIQQNPGYGK